MINSFLVDISEDGIVGAGGIYGTSAPSIGTASSLTSLDRRLKIHVRKVFLKASVSSGGNNTFLLPTLFGLDKVLLYLNGRLYYPGLDYTVQGNIVTWLNTNVTITVVDELIAWGPANVYTADAITFEYIDLTDLAVYSGSGKTFNLKANFIGGDTFPYNENSIFLFRDGYAYRPGASEDFTYTGNLLTNAITVANALPAFNVNTDRFFAFYYNLVPTQPYRLGEALFRFMDNSANPLVSLAAPLKSDLANSPNVFLNRERGNLKENYTIKPLQLIWDNTSDMNYSSGDKLDISYFVDLNVAITMFSENFIGSEFTADQVAIVNLPITPSRGMVFLNGVCSQNSQHTNGISSNAVDYNIVAGPKLDWSGDPALELDSVVNWVGFTDIYSAQYVEFVYKQGADTPFTLTTPIVDTSKVIYFLNGIPTFPEDLTFGVNGSSVALNKPGANTDHVQVFYFNEASYASLWKFEKITLASDWTQAASETNANAIILPKPAKSIKTTWLFVPNKQAPDIDYTLSADGSKIYNKGMGTLPSGYDIYLVYL